MKKVINKKNLPVILLLAGSIIIAAAFFLSKDNPIEPKPKPEEVTETPVIPDGDVVIPDKPDVSDPDYVSSDPSEPTKPDNNDDTTVPEGDSTPEDISGFPKPGDGGANQGKQDEQVDSSVSGWQTFRNEDYKFEINYPDTYTVYIGVPETKVFYLNVKNDPQYVEGIIVKLADAAGSANDVIERVEEDNRNDVFSEILEDETAYLFNVKVRKITATSPAGFYTSHYFFSRNGINYELIVNDEDDLREEIISSFKIIN